MNYNEIIKLLDAGYTREEIMNMNADPAPEPEPTPEPEPDTGNEFSSMVQEMRDAFAELKKEITAFNIMNTNMPADAEKTSEDIIANIINPEPKKKK